MRRTVDLLPQYDQNNGWFEQLDDVGSPQVLAGEQRVDTVVVGGGYAGLAVARRLSELRPDRSIALVDATRIGNNAAGRSSGFAIDHAHNLRAKGFADDVADAKLQIELNRAGLRYLEDTISAQGIDCGWVREGKVHAAATARGDRLLDNFAASLDAIDEDYTRLDASECARWFGTEYYRSGVHAPHSYLVQPAAMVRGLADTMPANVTVYEDSRVGGISYGSPHRLDADAGAITADTVVLAQNGFVAGFGHTTRPLITMITWGSLTRPLTDAEAVALGGRESYGIIAAHPAGTSVRRTADRRILIRNIFSFSRRSKITGAWWYRAQQSHSRSFTARYPMLPEVDFEHTWGGALSLTRNGAPLWGRLSRNVYACSVHNGVGIARGTTAGMLLAELIADSDHPLISAMAAKPRPSRNYPEPFNSWGVRLNARWRRWQAGAEE